MGHRQVVIKQSAADAISEISWFIESEGLVATAEKFADDIYDFIERLADTRRGFALCREPARAALGYKCVTYKRKYTIVFLETAAELIICEVLPSRNIYW